MAIKKGIQRPEDKKNTPNDPGRQAVPQKSEDKKVTKKTPSINDAKKQWESQMQTVKGRATGVEDRIRSISPMKKEQLKGVIRREVVANRGGSSDTEGILRREFQRAHTKK